MTAATGGTKRRSLAAALWIAAALCASAHAQPYADDAAARVDAAM